MYGYIVTSAIVLNENSLSHKDGSTVVSPKALYTACPVLCVSCPILVIYHYSVIVEMFCIGLYARHTFRKVEPSEMEMEEPLDVWRMEKAVQTEEIQAMHQKASVLSEEVQPGGCLINASYSPSYDSDSEDSLCRIEHAPLDGFHFPKAKGQHSRSSETVEPRCADEPGVALTHITVRANVNDLESKDVTVV